jgi:prepilin-type processing-associated H-X9-DG protein
VVAYNGTGVLASTFPRLDDYGKRAVASCLTHNNTTVATGHGKGVNALYGDGHVEWIGLGIFIVPYDHVPSGAHSSSYNMWIDQVWSLFDAQNT